MAGWTGATVQGVTQDRETTRLDLGDRLGGGALGEVWRARDAHGQPVVLRRVGRVEAADLREVRRLATVVRALPTPHLVRLRRCLGDEDDRMLLLDPAASSLTDLLAARGRLRSGEVVTVVAPLAEALGHAHAHGLAHGRVGLGSVLFTADGMPLLDGLGLEPLRRPAERLDVGDPALAVDDVRALGRLCGELLTGQPGPPCCPVSWPRSSPGAWVTIRLLPATSPRPCWRPAGRSRSPGCRDRSPRRSIAGATCARSGLSPPRRLRCSSSSRPGGRGDPVAVRRCR